MWQPLCSPPLVAEVISVPVLWLETPGVGGWTQHAGKDGLAACIALCYRMPWTGKEGQRNRFFRGPDDSLQWPLSIKDQGWLWFKDWTWRWTPRNVNSFVRTAKTTLSIYTQFPASLCPTDPLLLWHERFSMQRGNAAFQEPQMLYLMISGTGQAMQGFRNGKLLLIPSLLHLELYDLEYITGSFGASVYPFAFIKRGGEEYVKKNFSHSTYLQASMPLRMGMKICLR